MDWLEDFKTKFEEYEELKHIKEKKFHGSIVINFCEGISQNLDYKLHRRATKTIEGSISKP